MGTSQGWTLQASPSGFVVFFNAEMVPFTSVSLPRRHGTCRTIVASNLLPKQQPCRFVDRFIVLQAPQFHSTKLPTPCGFYRYYCYYFFFHMLLWVIPTKPRTFRERPAWLLGADGFSFQATTPIKSPAAFLTLMTYPAKGLWPTMVISTFFLNVAVAATSQ